MADLDPTIALQGMYTTHPTTPIPLGNQIQQAAQTNLAAQQGALTQQETQSAQLKNQIEAQQYKDAQILAQSQVAAFSAAAQAQQQPNPDGSMPVTKPGVNPKWTVAPNDQYLDENGNPVSHVDGPMFSPSGRPNMFSSDMINSVTKDAIAKGANPSTVLAWAAGQIQKGQEFDAKNVDIQSKLAAIQTSQADLTAKQDAHRQAVNEETANQAYLGFSTSGATPLTATQLLNDMPNYWAPKLQQAGVKVQQDPQTKLWSADTQNPAFLGTFQSAAQNSPAAAQAAKLKNETMTAEAGAASSRASAGATNLATAQDLAFQNPTAAARDPVVRQALGLNGDAAHDAPIIAQAAAASKARGASATATASQTETASKVGSAVGSAQQAIVGQQSVIDENNKTIAAIDRLTAKGNKGGLPTSVLGDLNTNFGNDPDYAQVREAAKFANVQRISQTLSAAGGGTGSARAMGPLLEATQDATKISKLPLATLRDQLNTANQIASDNIGLKKQELERANAQGQNLPTPVTGTAPQSGAASKGLAGRTGNLDDVRSFATKNRMTFDEAYEYLINHGAKIQ